ncbi:MAG: hypothetical protein ABEI80_05100 [Haloplanus sp.]
MTEPSPPADEAGTQGDDAPRPLDVRADLTLDVADDRVSIRGYGDLVVVAAPTVAVALTLAREAGPLLERLVATGVTVDCRVRGRSVARAGPSYDPGLLSRTLGVAPACVCPGGLLLSIP